MTIGELGSLGELIGAIATVATLLYLAIQIRANTLATKRKALDDTIDRVMDWAAHVVATPEHLNCWIKGHESFHKLPVDDQFRFAALNMEIFGAAEASLEAAKFGGVKSETVGAVTGIITQLALNNGVQEWWETNGRILFADDFSREVDRISELARSSTQDIPAIIPFQVPAAEQASS